MQAYQDGIPMGDEVIVTTEDIPCQAEKMFDDGADEIRMRRLPARGFTKSAVAHRKTRRRNKIAKASRKHNR